ncbi:PQQ-binding-like beta-propeller repeat protein [Carboxylicivirga sp. A043]|uniref:outer membrane protein assembly factor BamB family protein n=1 Tax=Carboxylicivirga litoralis TaxID=2816963 RepID=UPI0021CB47FA|nr:PQQ-binding-like beta-propeller repeat protein [Carboxylicivirga sp. A043]MCU4156157.1 PQQ-binding-like beta-propeller repeat protein [Carboxylicivirga sp. A043]
MRKLFNSILHRYVFVLLIMNVLWACNRPERLSIAFFTDIHVVPGNQHEEVFQKAIEEVNAGEFDFVVITGDLSNMGSDEELKAVKAILDNIEVPYYVLPGNHETNWSETGGATYQKLFGDDRFFFTTEAYQFVGFNTGPYMKMGDGHVKKEDVKWLKDRLNLSDSNKHLISLAHYPLMDGLDNWPEITAQLKKYDVKMAFCGHGHKLQLLNFNGIPGVMGRALIGRDKDDKGYNIIELEGDSVWVKSKQLGCELQLAFSWDIHRTNQIDSLEFPHPVDYLINKQFRNHQPEILFESPASIMGGVAQEDECLYWLASDGAFNCFDLATSEIKWAQNLCKPQYSTPVVYKHLTIVGTSQGQVKAFDKRSGKLVWETDVHYPVFSEGKIDGDDLYVACGKGGMLRLNASTGEVLWQYNEVNGFVQVTPCITDDKVIFGAWDTFLHCVDKNSGQQVWKWTNGHRAKLYSPGNVTPVVSNDKVFIVAPDRRMTVINLENGEQLFRTNKHKVRESSGISTDGRYFFAKLMNDSIVVYPTVDYNLEKDWSVNVGFGYEHNPVPLLEADGIVYGGTKNGEVFAVGVESKKLLWRYKISNSSINKLQFMDNQQLLVNSMDGKIVVFSK